MIKYRVHYFESESGWGNDSWNTDYDTEQEARKAYQECEDEEVLIESSSWDGV